jgi:pSer/pThr/pTyr-binding forkhead associated (FHA) protein
LRRYLLPLKPDAHQVFELSGPRSYVGRNFEANVCISQPTISRLHAVLYWIGGATIVEDARSSNGVFVNRKRVQQSVLIDGDVVAFGNVEYQFRVSVSDS